MSVKRIMALLLSLLLLLTLLPELAPSAQATPSVEGCTNSNDGKHHWYPRPRDPWCDYSGGYVYTCSLCNKMVFEETTPALGHDWPAWTVTKAATCTESGSRTRTCRRCQKVETQDISALGHSFSGKTYKSQADCEHYGIYYWTCTRCGYKSEGNDKPLGHDWDEGVVTKAPTATEDGIRTYTCKRDPSHTKTEVIPKGTAVAALYAKVDSISPNKEAYGKDETVKVIVSVKNTGSVPITPEFHTRNYYYNGKDNSGYVPNFDMLQPGESTIYSGIFGASAIGDYVQPGTGTAELLGVATSEFWFAGYASADHKQDSKDEALCESNHVDLGLKVLGSGDDGPHPGLSFTASWADDAGVGKRYEGAEVEYTYTFTNTGDCDVRMEFVASETVQSLTVSTGSTLSVPCEVELKPKDSVTMVIKRAVNQTWVDDGLVYIKGYRGGYYKDADGNEQIVKSNIAEVSIPLTYPDGDNGPHPGLTLTASWADDAGVGKRYEGAEVEYILTKTNTGDCPLTCYTEYGYIISIIGPSGPIAEGYYDVQPNESIIMTVRDVVTESHVESGIFNTGWKCGAHYIDADGQNKFIGSNKAAVSIPLTYPEGEEPEEAKPALEIKWDYDEIWPNGDWTIWTKTTEPGVIAPEDGVLADYTTINKGNVPLYVVTYATFGDGLTELSVRCLHKPGESESLHAYGSNPATEHLTPGTQTEDLLGTVTVSFYAVGYDPDQYVHIEKTGPELCHSETITRTWKVGKKTKWEIPEESQLTASLQVAPGYEHSDPAGYQLMEDYATVLYVKNTGGVDLDDFTVNDPWDGSVISGGPIKVDEVKSFPRASGTVTEKNVGDGSIVFPMITVTWTDPDSEENRPTYAGPLTLPVTSKTGLLVKKSVANKPAEGDYFKEDEVIKWGLTVTNNSKEPIKDVTVTDKGVTVGAYSEIAPGETKTCAVPDYTVTSYDADVVGYVINTAAATGTDIKGVTRT
ncbi:MAG: hypothetical protein IKT23_03910, partial [Clostridia bacterium]|nr:hypothetical protein [Clostridia bacterium]